MDSQDDLRIPLWSSAFFIVAPPYKIFNGILHVVILEEILPKQHGTYVGSQKKQNFVIQYNKMSQQDTGPSHQISFCLCME